MRRVTASTLLDAWERGESQKPALRALTLLSVACPESSSDERAAMSIGERDGQLLSLREHLFGAHLTSVTSCAACGENLELDFSIADVRVQRPDNHEELRSLDIDDWNIFFRAPSTADVLSMDDRADQSTQRRQLFERCVTSVSRSGESLDVADVPDDVSETVAARMALVDPQADVLLHVSCVMCGNTWQAVFDIASYLWAEVDAWVQSMLRDVHSLAAAYGWSESEILSMSAMRRQRYLELIRG